LWGIPLFLHCRQTTEIKYARSLIAPDEEPFGGWVLLRNLATPADRGNVLPNVDTLYGAAYLLLDKQGPVVLSLPGIKDRYYSVAPHDAYFNTFAVVGTRSTKGEAANVLILPPGYKGKVPGGFTRVIRAPTSGITAFQRIYTRDPSDVPTVRAMQDKIRFAPLATWKTADKRFPKIKSTEFNVQVPVRETRDPQRFFEIVSAHGCRNPPPADFAALVDAFKRVGLGPCAVLPATEAAKAASVPEGNWLPAPAGEFIVVLRTYLPSQAIQNGRWFPPALRRD
jgi:hypothetical protein